MVTTLFLLRLRHQLSAQRRGVTRLLMAEETVAVAFEGRTEPRWIENPNTLRLLEVTPSGNLDPETAAREIRHALTLLRASTARLETLARTRAELLLQDHRRVRDAAGDKGTYTVSPCLPVDVIGVYVLLPDSL